MSNYTMQRVYVSDVLVERGWHRAGWPPLGVERAAYSM